jgi:predicted nuclease of predicted toxin-antitoxin system
LTSRKRSAASFRSKRPSPAPPPLFIDRSLGRLASALHAQGAEVHTHDAHFAQDARDEEWLAEVGRRGWAVSTKDTRIRYRQTELSALIAGGVRAFVLTRGDLNGSEMAAIVVKVPPHLARFSARHHPRSSPGSGFREGADGLQAGATIAVTSLHRRRRKRERSSW